VIPAIEPKPMIGIEGDDPRIMRDYRMKQITTLDNDDLLDF